MELQKIVGLWGHFLLAFIWFGLVNNFCTPNTADSHLMISRCSGHYLNTLKVLDVNNKKGTGEGKTLFTFKIYILSTFIKM